MKYLLFLMACLIAGSAGATDPVDVCTREAFSVYGLALSDQPAKELCRKAVDPRAPIDCYRKAFSIYGLALNQDDAVSLCSGSRDAKGTIDCYSHAFSIRGLALSKAGAIDRCSER
jgi:hypothetical protein